MKKALTFSVSLTLMVLSCTNHTGQQETESNPFFSEFDTPFNVPPFEKIKDEHYLPAFQRAMKEQEKEIEAIVNTLEAPTFENTIEALEHSGVLLETVGSVLSVLNSTIANDNRQAIAKQVAPLTSKHRSDITLNEKLFERIETVYGQKDELDLTLEQNALLEKYYKDFVRGGATLDAEKKARMRDINEELSPLILEFGDNVLKANNRLELVIEKEEDLAGLAAVVVDRAAEVARERGHEGKWVFTRNDVFRFLRYSEKRPLREKFLNAYINRCNNNDDLDNKAIVSRIASLRAERANLSGYKTHSHFVLENNMVKNPETVYEFLDQLWQPALKLAKKEAAELQEMIDREGEAFRLQPWDWRYYAEKQKKAKYDLNEEELRPYFKLENVVEGAFAVANRLYGIQFVERTDIPRYHEDARVFEVTEADGSPLGIFYTDYFSRSSKNGGGWMTSFRKQSRRDGKDVLPVVLNVLNMSQPTGDEPALISSGEISSLFHELGHALHGLLSNCTYSSFSGTGVAGDFAEFLSQMMENWAFEPEVLEIYAKHHETGEVIPRELIDKLEKATHFNQGSATVGYLSAVFLDLELHTLTEPQELDLEKFETESLNKIGLIPEIGVRYRSTHFEHIFNHGHSSEFYSYIWTEVLDAHAFEVFEERGIFDQTTALSFRKNILERGGTEDPMTLYKRFRGAEPSIEPLLKRKGFVSQ